MEPILDFLWWGITTAGHACLIPAIFAAFGYGLYRLVKASQK